MANKLKIKKVQEIQQRFKESTGIYFTNYTGMNVLQANHLRREFTKQSIQFIITKNTLTKIAAKNAGFTDNVIENLCLGQVGIAYTKLDPTVPARILKDFIKENENSLKVTGFFLEGESFSAEEYTKMASLPSRDELLSKFIVGLNYPMTQFVSTICSPMSKLTMALNSIKNQKNNFL